MIRRSALLALPLLAPLASPAAAAPQAPGGPALPDGPVLAPPPGGVHAQVSSVATHPAVSGEVWVANRGNDSVSVIDTGAGRAVAEIEVGVWPRTLAFTPDGSTVFVANQRGNVAVTRHFVTPFDGTELRGSVSVIDAARRTVVDTLVDVGIEPYGLAVAPNGRWFAVTGFRSATVKFYDTSAPYALLASFAYDADPSHVPPGETIAHVDRNKDFLPDLAEPRAFVIRADGSKLYVTHSLSGYVSVLHVATNGAGQPLSVHLVKRIDLNLYPHHPIFDPTPVQTIASQGFPRFLDDVALSPDSTLALVPHLLHNVNHDVNHDFGVGLAGDFANRVYPAVSILDTVADTFSGSAQSRVATPRLEHEWSDPRQPAEHVPYGGRGTRGDAGFYTLGAGGAPVLGGEVAYTVYGARSEDRLQLAWSTERVSVRFPFGTALNGADFVIDLGAAKSMQVAVPAERALVGVSLYVQGIVRNGSTGKIRGLTNGLREVLGLEGFRRGSLGHRAGHPGRVLFNADGDRALLLNRGSEDVFLFEVSGGALNPLVTFPSRTGFVERTPFDTSTPLGDLPLGMALVDDPLTVNRDGVLYVLNETSRTLSSLRVDYDANTIAMEASQIPTLLGSDQMTLSERSGQEIFEDASRAQTAGAFNNSCGSCHFEGGADGNVWQRANGPRSTISVWGGSLLSGLLLWKGTRINMGETGPMFGGENGGSGVFSDGEQQALVDYHRIIPVPLNPNLPAVGSDYTALQLLGRDLFFGRNDTGLNPRLRHAGCASCHPDEEFGEVRAYTADFLTPLLTDGETLGTLDPNCNSLAQNLVAGNLENVNSAVNLDLDQDDRPDLDRNADGFVDVETYAAMNDDADDDFQRDDENSWPCPIDGVDPRGPRKTFDRDAAEFSVPTKLGVFATGPYFHDHSIYSLRTLLDPQAQMSDPVYGDPTFPGVNKFINEFHDVRGNGRFVPNSSKVQVTLQSVASGSTVDADLEALLAYISAL